MLGSRAAAIAKGRMESGYNCTQAILLAADEIFELNISQDTMQAAALFKEGMGAGSTCGTLIGMVMASGLVQARFQLPQDDTLASRLHQRFEQEFRSVSCREIHKGHSLLQKVCNRGCINMTARAASILFEEWAKTWDEDWVKLCAGKYDFGNNTNL